MRRYRYERFAAGVDATITVAVVAERPGRRRRRSCAGASRLAPAVMAAPGAVACFTVVTWKPLHGLIVFAQPVTARIRRALGVPSREPTA
jgi:hypothetical protein